jgi:hypothetical protein
MDVGLITIVMCPVARTTLKPGPTEASLESGCMDIGQGAKSPKASLGPGTASPMEPGPT